jgi:hypothetical protein
MSVTRVANTANMARAIFIGSTSLAHSVGVAWPHFVADLEET